MRGVGAAAFVFFFVDTLFVALSPSGTSGANFGFSSAEGKGGSVICLFDVVDDR